MAIKVNGEIVGAEAIEYELRRLTKFYSQHYTVEQLRERKDLLVATAREQAIGTRLLMDEAARRRIPVPEEEVDEAVRQMERDCGGPQSLDRILGRQKMDRQALRRSMANGKRLDRLVAGIVEGVSEPDDEELRAHFEAHADEYAMPERVNARHILIQPQGDGEEARAAAWTELEEIRERVLDGTDFAQMAAAYSDCPSGKAAGGSLGWVVRGAMVPEIDELLFTMDVGDVSEIVSTPLGLHVVEKVGHEQERPASFDEARERIRTLLLHERRGKAISDYVEKLKQSARIEVVEERSADRDEAAGAERRREA